MSSFHGVQIYGMIQLHLKTDVVDMRSTSYTMHSIELKGRSVTPSKFEVYANLTLVHDKWVITSCGVITATHTPERDYVYRYLARENDGLKADFMKAFEQAAVEWNAVAELGKSIESLKRQLAAKIEDYEILLNHLNRDDRLGKMLEEKGYEMLWESDYKAYLQRIKEEAKP